MFLHCLSQRILKSTKKSQSYHYFTHISTIFERQNVIFSSSPRFSMNLIIVLVSLDLTLINANNKKLEAIGGRFLISDSKFSAMIELISIIKYLSVKISADAQNVMICSSTQFLSSGFGRVETTSFFNFFFITLFLKSFSRF